MTEQETNRISSLTTGAITTTAENAIKAMMAAVEAAEEKTREMRAAVEEYAAEFQQSTKSLASNVATHVASCQTVIDSFQSHHLKILNVDPPLETMQEPAAVPAPRVLPKPKPALQSPHIEEELSKLSVIATEGRR